MRIKHHGPRSKSPFEKSLDELAEQLAYFEHNFDFLPAHVQDAVCQQLMRLQSGDSGQEAHDNFLKALAKELTRTGKHRKT